MSYKIINEKLKIKSCSIADMTIQQVARFTDQLNHDYSLGHIVMFEEPDGWLILNEDSKKFIPAKEFAELYMANSDEFKQKHSPEEFPIFRQEVEVMNACLRKRREQLEISRVRKSNMAVVKEEQDHILSKIYREESGFSMVMYAFFYGVIVGKRAERAKKKGVNHE